MAVDWIVERIDSTVVESDSIAEHIDWSAEGIDLIFVGTG